MSSDHANRFTEQLSRKIGMVEHLEGEAKKGFMLCLLDGLMDEKDEWWNGWIRGAMAASLEMFAKTDVRFAPLLERYDAMKQDYEAHGSGGRWGSVPGGRSSVIPTGSGI